MFWANNIPLRFIFEEMLVHDFERLEVDDVNIFGIICERYQPIFQYKKAVESEDRCSDKPKPSLVCYWVVLWMLQKLSFKESLRNLNDFKDFKERTIDLEIELVWNFQAQSEGVGIPAIVFVFYKMICSALPPKTDVLGMFEWIVFIDFLQSQNCRYGPKRINAEKVPSIKWFVRSEVSEVVQFMEQRELWWLNFFNASSLMTGRILRKLYRQVSHEQPTIAYTIDTRIENARYGVSYFEIVMRIPVQDWNKSMLHRTQSQPAICKAPAFTKIPVKYHHEC